MRRPKTIQAELRRPMRLPRRAAPSPGAQASQPGAPAKPDASPTAAAPDQIKQTQPKPEGAAAAPNVAQTQATGEPRPAHTERRPAPATKPSGKSKVNDVPVNPLE